MGILDFLSHAAPEIAGARGRSRQRKKASLDERIAAEDRTRRQSLEDLVRGQNTERHTADMASRRLEDELRQAQINAARNPAPKPSQRVYDKDRGGIVDEIEGTFSPIQGLPPALPKPQSETARDMAEKRSFDQSRQLGQDFKSNPVVKGAYDLARVAGGIKAGLAGESPIDDLSLIYETVKLFDPNSVVREGEIKLFKEAQSLPLQVQLMIQKWNTGRTLTPSMRAMIGHLVDRKIEESERGVRPVQAEFGEMARRYGQQRDSSFIAPDPFKGVTRRQLPNQDY